MMMPAREKQLADTIHKAERATTTGGIRNPTHRFKFRIDPEYHLSIVEAHPLTKTDNGTREA
jgi:hypothetical protein